MRRWALPPPVCSITGTQGIGKNHAVEAEFQQEVFQSWKYYDPLHAWDKPCRIGDGKQVGFLEMAHHFADMIGVL